MDRPTFSQSWSRVNRLTPKLRPHVQINRQLFRGEPWHVVHDPVSNNFFRLNPVAYYLVSMLDGRRSVDEVWRLTLDKYGDAAPTQQEVIGLLGQLNQSNLLRVDLSADAQPLLERHRRRKMKHWASQAMSILFMRFGLFNPDRLLTWMLPMFRPLLNRWGLIAWLGWIVFCIVSFLPEVGSFISDAESVLAPTNWLWMAVLFIATKAIHELGHGLICKRFGGVVPEIGIMLLVMFPAPFVDATSSWSFSDKWKRLLVAAAGMLVELGIAGGAALIWMSASPGSLTQQLAYNVVFLASVTTILFNANPLLRFDGYYMLSDVMEIPNLYERAQRQIKWIIQRYGYGLTNAVPVSSSSGERVRLTIYGIGAMIYRVLVLAGIILFISGQFLEIGIILAIWSAIAWLLIPLIKAIHWLLTSPALTEHRARAVGVTVMIIVGALLLTGVIDVEEHHRAQGVVQSVQRAEIAMLTAGFVTQVNVRSGDYVRKGDIILIADNAELRTKKVQLDARLALLKLQRLKGQTDDLVQGYVAGAQIESLEQELNRIRERLDDLTVRSPQDGTIVGGFFVQLQDRYLQRGEVIGRVMDLSQLRVTALLSQSQNASSFYEKVGRAELRTAGDIQTVIPVSHWQVFDSGRVQLPHPALGTAAGGVITLDPQDREGKRTMRPQFEYWLDLNVPPNRHAPLPGQRIHVRFTLKNKRPLLMQWIHQLRQLLGDRLSI
jgi:putative peptide zinc metalloprotease protein